MIYYDSNHTIEDFPMVIGPMPLTAFSLSVIGFMGSLLAAWVWSDDVNKPSSLFLLSLAIYDLIFLGGSVIFYTPGISKGKINLITINAGLAVSKLALCGSSLSTVAITVERYTAVVRPLKVNAVCHKKRARLVVLGIAGICFVYGAIYTIYIAVVVMPGLRTMRNSTLDIYSVNHIHVETNGICDSDVYNMWLLHYEYDFALGLCDIILVYIGPWLTIFILNILLIKEMTSDIGVPFRSSARRQQEHRLVLSVMAVCALTLVSHPVGCVVVIWHLFNHEHAINICIRDVWAVLRIVNSGANFIFYSTISSKFRSTLGKKIRCS